ncbi:RNA polymerase sigma factor [Neptuniibacter sp. SY11_33]|uniref:RNA polymerase sigma factor n=1 Tax=Neptuniibacter sp. SY11_33 TaxID=3398215 RepID=UPI0039F63020
MQPIEQFLIKIERRAFQIARIATGCDQDALDIVQDVMLKFVYNYSDKPDADWQPLFHRMLQNRITDFHRRKTLTNRIFSWISFRTDEGESEISEEEFVDPSALLPEDFLQHERFGDALIKELEALPQRQQQAFLLRIWEGLSVKETAEAMACSEGSIKTHLSRATARLKQQLHAQNFIGLDNE